MHSRLALQSTEPEEGLCNGCGIFFFSVRTSYPDKVGIPSVRFFTIQAAHSLLESFGAQALLALGIELWEPEHLRAQEGLREPGLLSLERSRS